MKRASDDLERQDVEAQRAADEAELEAWLVDAPAVLAAALAATPALEDIVTKVQRPCWCFFVIAFWCVAGPLAPGLPLAHCCQVSGGAWVKAGWVCPGPVLRQVGALACLSCAAGIARPLKYTHLLGTLMHGRCRLGSMQSQRHPFLGAPRHGAVGLARLRRCCGVRASSGARVRSSNGCAGPCWCPYVCAGYF